MRKLTLEFSAVSQPPQPPQPKRIEALLSQPHIISWLASLAVHLLAMIWLALFVSASTQSGPALVVLSMGEDETVDSDAPSGPTVQQGDGPAEASSALSLADVLNLPIASDPTSVLPRTEVALGPESLEAGEIGSAKAGLGPSQTAAGGRLKGVGGKARTSVFGAPGEGYTFVYVFDRSGSMGGSGRNALMAAKRELLASLQQLEPTHQFQIIFYNDRLTVFNPGDNAARLIYANEQNKAAAERFINSITAEGGTEHYAALLFALKFRPDVIFFLTDADEPKLTPGQLERIHRAAGGTVINAIEFGYGPQEDKDNFIVRLARQNGGTHVYVDVSRMAVAAGEPATAHRPTTAPRPTTHEINSQDDAR